MANIRSAQKRARQSAVRAVHNRAIKTRVKTARKAVSEAIASGDKEEAGKRLRVLTSAADKAAKSGVIHKNSASRLKGLYTHRIAALG